MRRRCSQPSTSPGKRPRFRPRSRNSRPSERGEGDRRCAGDFGGATTSPGSRYGSSHVHPTGRQAVEAKATVDARAVLLVQQQAQQPLRIKRCAPNRPHKPSRRRRLSTRGPCCWCNNKHQATGDGGGCAARGVTAVQAASASRSKANAMQLIPIGAVIALAGVGVGGEVYRRTD